MGALLEDPELVKQLDDIEKSSDASNNAYCSRQATIEFCKMMWKLSQEEGTNPYKEMRLLEEIIKDPELKKVFFRDELLEKLLKKGTPAGGHHDMKTFLDMILDNYKADESVREFCRVNRFEDYISSIIDFQKNKHKIEDESLREIKERENDKIIGVIYGALQHLMSKDQELSLIDLGGGNGDKAVLLMSGLPFRSFTYLNVDISSYMSAIASKNLERLATHGIQIKQEERWMEIINSFQKVLLMSEQDKIQVLLKEAYDCAAILESVNELRITRTPMGNFSIYCTYKLYETLWAKATDEEKVRMKRALNLEKEIETRRLSYSRRRSALTYQERVENQEMINFTERTFHELFNKFDSNDSLDDNETRLIYKYSKARHFALNDWRPIIQRCYDELIQFARVVKGAILDERAAELIEAKKSNQYLIKYFRNLVEVIRHNDFEIAATLCPYPHIKSVWMHFLRPREGEEILRDVPNNDNSWMCGESLPKNNLDTFDFIFGVSGSGADDAEFDGEMFGPNRLERTLLEDFFGRHKTIMAEEDGLLRYCTTTTRGITLDFTDFEKVYKTTQGIASGLLGRQKMYLLLGQTLGNYGSEERALLVQRFYDNMQQGDFFLIGIDMAPECKTQEARDIRLKQMQNEYCKAEDFVRSAMNSKTAQVNAVYDATNNDIVINVEDNGQSKEFFRSHKFNHQEITGLLQTSGFKILGSKYYTNPRNTDFGLEYGVILCQKQ